MVHPPGETGAFYITKVDKSQRFQLLGVDGITTGPDRQPLKPGDVLEFTLRFEGIEDAMNSFHLIEGDAEPGEGITLWHFYNVVLH